MSARLTLATAARVLRQIRHDPRTLGLLVVVPCVLVGLLAWIYRETPVFDLIGAPLIGVFPFVVMFLITSIATLRERRTGTLERLLAMPLGKGDLLAGYALAFGLLAAVQAVVVTAFSLLVLGLDVAGDAWLLLVVAVAVAVLGTALGLFLSAFAATEFQAGVLAARVRVALWGEGFDSWFDGEPSEGPGGDWRARLRVTER